MIARERKKIDVEEVNDKRAEIAAFFDLDGTLMARPSFERKFFRELRHRRTIGMKNYLWWVAQALRLAPRGIAAVLQANKMYLRGVSVAGRKKNSGDEMKLTFYSAAIEGVVWHAERGDTIVILSGTLDLLARRAARELEMILMRRGIATKVHVCATRLEEKDGFWTGQIIGEAMFGEAKARAMRRLAVQMEFDLKKSHAYGDSAQDWWMLDAVGNPRAANPSPGLLRLTEQNHWPVVWWNEREELTHRAQRAQSPQRSGEAIARPGSLE